MLQLWNLNKNILFIENMPHGLEACGWCLWKTFSPKDHIRIIDVSNATSSMGMANSQGTSPLSLGSKVMLHASGMWNFYLVSVSLYTGQYCNSNIEEKAMMHWCLQKWYLMLLRWRLMPLETMCPKRFPLWTLLSFEDTSNTRPSITSFVSFSQVMEHGAPIHIRIIIKFLNGKVFTLSCMSHPYGCVE